MIEYEVIIELAKDIAAGMDHLHQNKIVHRDLAARNILIQVSIQERSSSVKSEQSREKNEGGGGRLTPKISDFGLSGSGKRITRIPVR